MVKTDLGDAFLIADFARVGRCKKLRPFKAAQHIALKPVSYSHLLCLKFSFHNLLTDKLYQDYL